VASIPEVDRELSGGHGVTGGRNQEN
jgi:hypothetical protein